MSGQRLNKHRLAVSAICGMIVLAAPEPARSAKGIFDGVYTGKGLVKQGPSSACPSEENVSVTIKAEILKYTVGSRRRVVMGFFPRPDGSFSRVSVGSAGRAVVIQGRVVGDVLDADVTKAPCEFHWHLTKEQHRAQ